MGSTEFANGAVLSWPGKKEPSPVPPLSGRLVETFEPTRAQNWEAPPLSPTGNMLWYGDNRRVLAHLLANGYGGKVKLIYIDPPFDSGIDYTSRVQLRGEEACSLGERVQYSDNWASGRYLQFMYERLWLLRDLLAEDGTLWLHCDYRKNAHLQLLLEEVFGAENCLNTISWRSQVARGAKVHAFYFPRSTHYIHIFARNSAARPTWHPPRREIVLTRAEAAARYMEDEGGFFRTSHPGTYSFERLVELHEEGRLYAPYDGEVVIDEENRSVYASNGGNIGIKYYVEQRGRNRFVVTRAVDNLWDDIPGLGTIPTEDVNYPTQKTEGLLRRIIETATDPGDLVLDCFAGSGTTPAVAQKLHRAWIACDSSPGSVQTTSRRLQSVIQEQKANDDRQPADEPTLSFTTHRIDGDQSSKHGEKEGTASMRISVQRTSDSVCVEVRAFSLPTVAERLSQPISDWRALVQSIAIDPAYDGRVFRAVYADAPLDRQATVCGRYELPAPPAPTTVAIKLVDVLGGERLVTESIQD